MTNTLEPLRYTKTILLTTYKRDGTPIGTPVSIAFDGERAFFRSYDKAWKTKRLRNNPRVEVTPCTLRGKPTGEPIPAEAMLLDDKGGPHGRQCVGKPTSGIAGDPRSSRPPDHALQDDALRAEHVRRVVGPLDPKSGLSRCPLRQIRLWCVGERVALIRPTHPCRFALEPRPGRIVSGYSSISIER